MAHREHNPDRPGVYGNDAQDANAYGKHSAENVSASGGTPTSPGEVHDRLERERRDRT